MNHPDPIYDAFISRQPDLLQAFAEINEGLLNYQQVGANAWMLQLHCKGLVRQPNQEVEEVDHFQIGLMLPPDYCRRVDPGVVTLLTPHVWHPNVRGPAMCLGRMRPSTPIFEVIPQIVEILSYVNYTPREEDALNREACQWARNHTERFPLERRGIRLPSLTV